MITSISAICELPCDIDECKQTELMVTVKDAPAAQAGFSTSVNKILSKNTRAAIYSRSLAPVSLTNLSRNTPSYSETL